MSRGRRRGKKRKKEKEDNGNDDDEEEEDDERRAKKDKKNDVETDKKKERRSRRNQKHGLCNHYSVHYNLTKKVGFALSSFAACFVTITAFIRLIQICMICNKICSSSSVIAIEGEVRIMWS